MEYYYTLVLTLWVCDKMAAIMQTTFSNPFSWMEICFMVIEISLRIVPNTENKGRQFDNFVVTGGTVSCHNNLRCHQWRQSCQIDILLFSVQESS